MDVWMWRIELCTKAGVEYGVVVILGYYHRV